MWLHRAAWAVVISAFAGAGGVLAQPGEPLDLSPDAPPRKRPSAVAKTPPAPVPKGVRCRLYPYIGSIVVNGHLKVDTSWTFVKTGEHPKNAANEYIGYLVEPSGRVRRMPDSPYDKDLNGTGQVGMLKHEWDCRTEAERKEQADLLAAIDRQNKEDQRRLAECRKAPDSLIGLSRQELRSRCGRWTKVNKTITASRTSEQMIYQDRFYVYVDNDVVTAVQDH